MKIFTEMGLRTNGRDCVLFLTILIIRLVQAISSESLRESEHVLNLL